MMTRIDRLARSIGDLQDIVRTVRARGASLKATEQPIDTGVAGKCFWICSVCSQGSKQTFVESVRISLNPDSDSLRALHLARIIVWQIFSPTRRQRAHDGMRRSLGWFTTAHARRCFRWASCGKPAEWARAPELITRSREEYEERAIELALNPEMLESVKEKLDRTVLQRALRYSLVDAAYGSGVRSHVSAI
jgi:hypothetical protein